LSVSIFIHFVAIHSKIVRHSRTLQKKNHNPLFWSFNVFKVITVSPLKIPSLVLVMISSMSMPICNRFHARRANTGKILFGGTPLLRLS